MRAWERCIQAPRPCPREGGARLLLRVRFRGVVWPRGLPEMVAALRRAAGRSRWRHRGLVQRPRRVRSEARLVVVRWLPLRDHLVWRPMARWPRRL